jgi:hypothetical protein
MNSTLEALATINETTLNYITSVQENVLAAHRSVVAAMPRPEIPAALASWIPAPQPELAREFVAQTSAFAAKLLQANTAFALGLLSPAE